MLLVWQGIRKKNLDILYRFHEGAWGKEGFVTENPASDWEPAVAVTAYGRVEDRIRSVSAGFDLHLPKPVEPAELIAVVANLARRR